VTKKAIWLTTSVMLACTFLHGQSKRLLLHESELSFLGFTIGKSTFEDITRKLGPSEKIDLHHLTHDPVYHGDEAVCYKSANRPNTIVLFVTGAMGGWHEITGFIIAKKSAFPGLGDCPTIKGSIGLLRNLSFSSSRADLKKAFGRACTSGDPTTKRTDTLEFCRDEDLPFAKKKDSDPDTFNRGDWVTARFKNDRLIYLDWSRIDSL
jgi:hypothetical protein